MQSKSDEEFWIKYKRHLISLNQSPHTIRNKIQHAKRFGHILETRDARELLVLSKETRSHAMKSLSALAKYHGKYDIWLELIKRFQLKWEQRDSLDTFKRIFDNNDGNYTQMLTWVRDCIHRLPSEYGNIILFATLTGLRPDESIKALSLLKTESTDYIDHERMMLIHYRFPDMFLRVSKKAFVSIINKDLLEIGNATPMNITYSSVRKRLKKLNISMHLYYCRKVFATYLRNKGIEPEIIDLLQGRISDSVFVNHYYRPDINEIITKRIRPLLNELRTELKG
jgi:hypothetical protein